MSSDKTDKDMWLPADDVCNLLGIKIATLKRYFKSGKYIFKKRKVKGKNYYSVLLSSMPVRARNLYLMLKKSSQTE